MQTIIMISQFLLSLSFLVFIHELGHFLAAKFFKVRVEKFYLFFDFLFPVSSLLNFSIFKKTIGETEYGLGWFPLGGYVKISGIIDESYDDSKNMTAPPEPYEYRAKKWWQKLIIIMAGIIFNIILAFIIFWALHLLVNREYIDFSEMKPGDVVYTETAKKFGFKDNDIILNVNGKSIKRSDDITDISVLFGGYYTVSTIENKTRVEKRIEVPNDFYKYLTSGPIIYPKYHRVKVKQVVSPINQSIIKPNDLILSVDNRSIDDFGTLVRILDSNRNSKVRINLLRDQKNITLEAMVDTGGRLGFIPDFEAHRDRYRLTPYSIIDAAKYSLQDCYKMLYLQSVSIVKMTKGKMPVKENLGGPIKLAQMFGIEWDWVRFWTMTATISLGLAFMNALPLPVLDGGHALIILIELVIRRELPTHFKIFLMNVSIILLMALMIYVFYNDSSQLLNP